MPDENGWSEALRLRESVARSHAAAYGASGSCVVRLIFLLAAGTFRRWAGASPGPP